MNVGKWQKEFYERPRIYWTRYCDGEPTGNFYETRDAAQTEIDFLKAHGDKKAVIMSTPIHDMKLARERWAGISEGE